MEVVTLGINRRNSESQGGENLVRINKKSDFPLAVRLLRGGQVVPFPECDFTMEAHIEGSSDIYWAERKGGVCKHCKQDGDRLILFFDNHNFAEGRLLMELTIEYPDPDYSEDGIRQEHFIEVTPIQVVADNGDALDLRLPEPKVVERVVEKIVEVEKPVEKIVEKVVEKVVDNNTYTDLQKEAADWVSRMEKDIIDHPDLYSGEQGRFKKVLGIFFKKIRYVSLQTVSPTLGVEGDNFLFSGVSSSDEDFEDKLEFSKFLLGGFGGYSTSYLYSNLNMPGLNLTITLPDTNKTSYVGLFYNSILNTITINAFGKDFLAENLREDDMIEYYNGLSMFNNCTANKVVVNMKSGSQDKEGWYILSSIGYSNVKCFEFCGGNSYKQEYRIDNIIKKLLPDARYGSASRPNLIFRDYTGEATEELKQIVLDKDYPSVEFYMNDTKVL